MSKDEPLPTDPETGKPERTGRTWGVWRRELLAIRYRTIPITGASYLVLRRVFRRIARPKSGRSALRRDRFDRQHAFIDYGEAMRLLEHLGVSPP